MACGKHVILDCYGCDEQSIKDQTFIEAILCQAAETAGATVLHTYFHKFDKGEGVTGVIALSESHISIHTWPEYNYMAIDIFMCGKCDPRDSVDYIISTMVIERYIITDLERGDEI